MVGGPKVLAGSRKTNTFRTKKAEGTSDSCGRRVADLCDVVQLLCDNEFVFDGVDLAALACTTTSMVEYIKNATTRLDWPFGAEKCSRGEELFALRRSPKVIKDSKVVQIRSHLETKDYVLLSQLAPTIIKLAAWWDGTRRGRSKHHDSSTKKEKKKFAKQLFTILSDMHSLESLFINVDLDDSFPKVSFDLGGLKKLKHVSVWGDGYGFYDPHLTVSISQPLQSLQKLILYSVIVPGSFTPPSTLRVLGLRAIAQVKEINFTESSRLEGLEMDLVPKRERFTFRAPAEEDKMRIQGMESLRSLKHLKMCRVDVVGAVFDQLSDTIEYLSLESLFEVERFGSLPQGIKHLHIQEVYGLEDDNPQVQCIYIDVDHHLFNHHLAEFPDKCALLPLILPNNLDWLSLDTDICCRATLPSNLSKLCITSSGLPVEEAQPFPRSFFKFAEPLQRLELRASEMADIISSPHLSMGTWSNIFHLAIIDFPDLVKVTCPAGLVTLELRRLENLEVVNLPDSLEVLIVNQCATFDWNKLSLVLKKNIKRVYLDTGLGSITFDGNPVAPTVHWRSWLWEDEKPPKKNESHAAKLYVSKVITRRGGHAPPNLEKEIHENYIFNCTGKDCTHCKYLRSIDDGDIDSEWKLFNASKDVDIDDDM